MFQARESTPLFDRRARAGSTTSSSSEEDGVRSISPIMEIEREPLAIVSAKYEPLRSPVPWKTRFVTSQLRQRVSRKGGGIRLCMKREFNRYFGDPCPGEPKKLIVVFLVRGREYELKWVEGALVNVTAETIMSRERRTTSGASSPRLLTARVPTEAVKDNFPHAALSVIMSFLPVYPDRFMCQLVCKEWALSLASNGLTEELRIGAPDIPGPCYLDQPPSFVEMIVSKSKMSLRILDLSFYDKLTDEIASRILRSSERLAHLDLTDCSKLQDASVMCIASSCPNLIVLTLKRVSKLTDVSLVPIAKGCLKLERLDLSELRNITDETLETIGHNLKNLRALFLRENHKLTDRGISTLCSAVERREGFEKKRRVEASVNLRRVRELSLCGLHRLTAKSLAGFPIPSLRSLSLEGCLNLDDTAFEDLCRSSSSKTLLSLNLGYCHKLSDIAIQMMANSMMNLQHLNICYLYRITDVALHSIAEKVKDLRSLDVSHCMKITPNGISSCLLELHNLSELRIRSCKQFDDSTIDLITNIFYSDATRECRLNLLDARNTSVKDFAQALSGLHRLSTAFSEAEHGCFVRW